MSISNGITGLLNRVADFLLLNILYLISCIPIITIGAATTAMYYVVMKMAEKERVDIVSDFKKSFKENFKQATIIWLMLFSLLIVIIANTILLPAMEQQLGTIVGITSFVVLVFLTVEILYVFPMLARFENRTKNIITNSLYMAIRHLPRTFIIGIIHFIPIVLGIVSLELLIKGYVVVLLFTVSILAYMESLIFTGIFKKYYPK